MKTPTAQPGAIKPEAKKGCEDEHRREGQTGDDVFGDRPSVSWHGRIVPRAVVDLDARQLIRATFRRAVPLHAIAHSSGLP